MSLEQHFFDEAVAKQVEIREALAELNAGFMPDGSALTDERKVELQDKAIEAQFAFERAMGACSALAAEREISTRKSRIFWFWYAIMFALGDAIFFHDTTLAVIMAAIAAFYAFRITQADRRLEEESKKVDASGN